MKILSWNVNGIRAVIKKGFYEYMNDINGVVLCLGRRRGDGLCWFEQFEIIVR